jgi:hypothetical protein
VACCLALTAWKSGPFGVATGLTASFVTDMGPPDEVRLRNPDFVRPD